MITLAVVGVILVVVIISVAVSVTRISHQRVSMHDGELITTVMGEREAAIPTSEIGVLLYVPESDTGYVRNKMGVFDYGGIIILNREHRLIRVIQHYAGSTLALAPIYQQIPAEQKIDFTGKTRVDLVKLFPNSLGFFQLRGGAFWALVPLSFVVAGIIVVIAVGIFVSALPVAFG